MTVKTRVVGDVSALQTYAFGHRSIMWWGTLGFMLIEGTGFLLAGGAYLFLRGQVHDWPPSSSPPDLIWGTLFTLVLVASAVPNVWLSRKAHEKDLRAVRQGLVIMTLLAVVALGLRAMEFTALHERWDKNAYGSIVWALMLLHATHVATDLYDTIVLGVALFVTKVDGRRFSDVSDNALYWNFVILTWLPIYFLIYWFPRLT